MTAIWLALVCFNRGAILQNVSGPQHAPARTPLYHSDLGLPADSGFVSLVHFITDHALFLSMPILSGWLHFGIA